MSRTINTAITGPLVLSLSDPLASGGSDDPLTITSTGTVNSTGNGIDGDASALWIIQNAGTLSFEVNNIVLAGNGEVANSGEIYSQAANSLYAVGINGFGIVINTGNIFSAYGAGVSIGSGVVINDHSIGSIHKYGVSVGSGIILNRGDIRGGIALGSGKIINTGSSFERIVIGSGAIFNSGFAHGIGYGIELGDASKLFNQSAGEVTGGDGGVFGGNGDKVVNQGTILPGRFYPAVQLGDNGSIANSGTLEGGVELGGHGKITNSGIFGGPVSLKSGQVSNSGTMTGPVAITSDGTITNTGTIEGAVEAASVLNNGTIALSGSSDITAAINPASRGVFNLLGGSTLEVAAALGGKTQMSFAGASDLVIDQASLFGSHVGAGSYTGPMLEDFVSGATIDIKDFGPTGLTAHYSSASGLLQLTNGAAQAATLHFQNTSLGSGAFHYAADGTGGLLITHS